MPQVSVGAGVKRPPGSAHRLARRWRQQYALQLLLSLLLLESGGGAAAGRAA